MESWAPPLRLGIKYNFNIGQKSVDAQWAVHKKSHWRWFNCCCMAMYHNSYFNVGVTMWLYFWNNGILKEKKNTESWGLKKPITQF